MDTQKLEALLKEKVLFHKCLSCDTEISNKRLKKLCDVCSEKHMLNVVDGINKLIKIMEGIEERLYTLEKAYVLEKKDIYEDESCDDCGKVDCDCEVAK